MPHNSNHFHANKPNKLTHAHKPPRTQTPAQTHQQPHKTPQPSQPQPHNQQTKEYLSGTIERITYHSSENGFCVLRVKAKSHKDLVTVTGNVPTPCVGEYRVRLHIGTYSSTGIFWSRYLKRFCGHFIPPGNGSLNQQKKRGASNRCKVSLRKSYKKFLWNYTFLYANAP